MNIADEEVRDFMRYRLGRPGVAFQSRPLLREYARSPDLARSY
jgi:hypothetical protein